MNYQEERDKMNNNELKEKLNNMLQILHGVLNKHNDKENNKELIEQIDLLNNNDNKNMQVNK